MMSKLFTTFMLSIGLSASTLFAMNIAEKDIVNPPLTIEQLDRNPMNELKKWVKEASEQPPTFALATASKEGIPSIRMMIVKEITDEGVVFVGDRNSLKAQNLKENPYAAVDFYFPKEQRQLIVAGKVRPLTQKEAQNYFKQRERSSQIASLVSHQDETIHDKKELLDAYKEMEEQYEDKDISAPESWGGFVLIPSKITFWQAGAHLLHDNITFTTDETVSYQDKNKKWTAKILAP
ncbi:MAG: pyridoxal 5'-phosphate synthase [Chlamydiales bacterium]|nr:pyridoxal 5'-phosphate synthase [Chlamydiales bacterium]